MDSDCIAQKGSTTEKEIDMLPVYHCPDYERLFTPTQTPQKKIGDK
jgi:hypothetical protein